MEKEAQTTVDRKIKPMNPKLYVPRRTSFKARETFTTGTKARTQFNSTPGINDIMAGMMITSIKGVM